MSTDVYAKIDFTKKVRKKDGDGGKKGDTEESVELEERVVDDIVPGPQEDMRDNAAGRQTQGQRSKTVRWPLRVIAGCLGMLCLMLLGVIIGQAVRYHSPSNSMTNDTLVHDYNQLKSNYDTLALENTQLKTNYATLNREKNELATNYNREKNELATNYNREKNQLATKNDALNWEKNQLATKNDALNREKNELATKYATLNREKNQLTTKYATLNREKNQLTTNYNREKNELATKNDALNREKNELATNYNREKNQLTTNYNQEKNELETKYATLNREKNELATKNDALNRENNQLKTKLTPVENDKSCPSGWKKFGCSCYYTSTEMKSLEESREQCLKTGADLVIINSQEEQDFINGLSEYTSPWIGLKRTEDKWTWVNGTPLTTQFWASTYPVNDEAWNCVYHFYHKGWHNGLCSDKTWICEKRCFS